MYPGTASSTRTALVARLARPRTRAAVAVVLALVAEAAIFVPLRDWDEPAVLAAIGVLIAVLAGAFGGLVAGVVAAAVGFALQFVLLDQSAIVLVALPAWLAAGAVSGWLGTRSRSVAAATEERRAHEAAKYRALTEHLPVVTYLLVADERAAPLAVSPQLDRLLGYTADEWLREPGLFLKLVHPEDRERVEAELARTPEDLARESEYRLLARDGRVVWVRDAAVVVRDASGEPIGVQGYLLDVSERHRADEDRKQLRAAEASAASEAIDRQRKVDVVAQAAAFLAASLDYRSTMREVAALAARELADWCVVDLLEEDGTLTRLAVERGEGTRSSRSRRPSRSRRCSTS